MEMATPAIAMELEMVMTIMEMVMEMLMVLAILATAMVETLEIVSSWILYEYMRCDYLTDALMCFGNTSLFVI